MSFMRWLAVDGVVLFVVLLFVLASAYAAGKLRSAGESQTRTRWLPHSLRMKPLGHGIYAVHDERRADERRETAPGDGMSG